MGERAAHLFASRSLTTVGLFIAVALTALATWAYSIAPQPAGRMLGGWDPPHLREIDASDGISAQEADSIADVYFEKFLGSCGGTIGPRPTLFGWNFILVSGPGGRYRGDMYVDLRTGGVEVAARCYEEREYECPSFRSIEDLISGRAYYGPRSRVRVGVLNIEEALKQTLRTLVYQHWGAAETTP